jgi:hypothetical protein
MRGKVNTVVEIFGAYSRLWCRIVAEVAVYLLYEDVILQSMNAIGN